MSDKIQTRSELLLRAEQLDGEAAINEQYAAAMERTTERTAGRLGHLHNPLTYQQHRSCAKIRRAEAAVLRERAGRL